MIPDEVNIVNISGGKDSTAMYLLALERGIDFKPVFADTDNEHEHTYEFVDKLHERTGGPKVVKVKHDFTPKFEARRAAIKEKWTKDGVPDDVVERAVAALHPTGNSFLDMVLLHGIFPMQNARFCTQELKILPIREQVYKKHWDLNQKIISWQGVRKDESAARSVLAERQVIEDEGPMEVYRPILDWTIEDVWAMHKKHGIEPNPLYALGMGRVGCFPCIYAGKEELRAIAHHFPEHIDRIAEWEAIASAANKRGHTTFFSYKSPKSEGLFDVPISYKTHGVHAKVRWAQTERVGKQNQKYDPTVEYNTQCNHWGMCE